MGFSSIHLLYLLALLDVVGASSITGAVRYEGDLSIGVVHVALFRLGNDGESTLTKRRLLGADSFQPLKVPPSDSIAVATRQNSTSWTFAFRDVAPGNYTAVAFEPAGADHGHWLDFTPPRRQAMGFISLKHDGSAPQPYSDSVRAGTFVVGHSQDVIGVDIVLYAPHLMPPDQSVSHGSLRKANGLEASILHVAGDAYERGFAHGFLLARQIIDFFDFFLIEDTVRSEAFYLNDLVPALKAHVALSKQLQRGAEGMLAGMHASNHSLRTCLGRDIELIDIIAINSYADAHAWTASNSTEDTSLGSSCSQFVFWGDAVAPDLAHETITGRNMDGEIDVRKLTVNYLVIHAVEPSEEGLQKYVHVMWPGFLGASSGFNAQGRYHMEDAGCNPPGAPAKHSPLLRDVISSLLLDSSVGPNASPDQIGSAILSHKSEAGGSCMNGCIIVTAEPFTAGKVAGFIYEGDRFGGAMRMPGDAPPVAAQAIMATNHYLRYNAVPGHPEMCNGVSSSFSSLARYFAGQNKLEAWMRRGQLSVGTDEMKELLQTVAHGTTEHSIIFKPNQMKFELAVASPNGVWDAPYSTWREFSFSDLFKDSDSFDGQPFQIEYI